MRRLLGLSLALGVFAPFIIGCSQEKPKDPEIISVPDRAKMPQPKAPANKPSAKFE